MVVAKAEVKQKTCGGRWLCRCWTKRIEMLNKVRKRRGRREEMETMELKEQWEKSFPKILTLSVLK